MSSMVYLKSDHDEIDIHWREKTVAVQAASQIAMRLSRDTTHEEHKAMAKFVLWANQRLSIIEGIVAGEPLEHRSEDE